MGTAVAEPAPSDAPSCFATRRLDPALADRSRPQTDPDDPVLFPRLSDRQLDAIAGFAECRQYAIGDLLFDQGESEAALFVLKSGRVEFFDRQVQADVLISTAYAGTFLGDISMFTGAPTIAAAVAVERSRVMVVSHADLKKLIAEQSDIGDLILRTFIARRDYLDDHDVGRVALIGPGGHGDTYRLHEFLDRNGLPVRWSDPATDSCAAALLERLHVPASDLPLLLTPHGLVRRPSLEDVARKVGLRPELKPAYDLVVIGGGPAGLAATVYGASEGLDTLMIDAFSPGGQAGTSSKIENYLGFAVGVSGDDLARQAVLQARKFGATLCNPCTVSELRCDDDDQGRHVIALADGTAIASRAIVLATGAKYRKLPAKRGEDFDGAGVYYACGHVEAASCENRQVAVVGAGNSAGQAAVFLSGRAKHVRLVVRGDDLGRTMSDYLIKRIREAKNIELLLETQVQELRGETSLSGLVLAGQHAGEVPCTGLFVMIGATPNTGWLHDCVGRCEKGFVATGPDAATHPLFARHWDDAARPPHLLETTRPGVFAAGDVRSGSVKRVAAGVGEGSMAIAFVHDVLARQAAKGAVS